MLRTTETRDYRLIRISGGTDIFASRSFISEALPSCRGAAKARHFASSVDAARVSEKHSRAQAFAHPSRAVRHPRLSPVCAHRASVARVARRGFRPVLPGVAIARANAESHDTGNIPPESARGCRARALLAATLPRIGSPRVFFRTLPVTPRRNLTPSSPPRPSCSVCPLSLLRDATGREKEPRLARPVVGARGRRIRSFDRRGTRERPRIVTRTRRGRFARARAVARSAASAFSRAHASRDETQMSQERFPRGIEALAPLSAHAGVRKTPDAMDRARRRARESARRLTLPSPLSFTHPAARTSQAERAAHTSPAGPRSSRSAEPRHRESRCLGILSREFQRIFVGIGDRVKTEPHFARFRDFSANHRPP